jgi:hypothetical protein
MRNGENRMLRATNTGLIAPESAVRDKTLPFELSDSLEALTELPYNILE